MWLCLCDRDRSHCTGTLKTEGVNVLRYVWVQANSQAQFFQLAMPKPRRPPQPVFKPVLGVSLLVSVPVFCWHKHFSSCLAISWHGLGEKKAEILFQPNLTRSAAHYNKAMLLPSVLFKLLSCNFIKGVLPFRRLADYIQRVWRAENDTQTLRQNWVHLWRKVWKNKCKCTCCCISCGIW